jgi:type IV secretory pathway TraG/TraD family ATPase VirD4
LIILFSRHFNRTLTIFSFAVLVSTIFALFKQYIPIFFIAATAYGYWRKDRPGAILGLFGSVLVFFVDAWVLGSLLALAKGAFVGEWLFRPYRVALVFLTGKGTEFELSARGAWLVAQPLLVVTAAFLAMFRLRFFDLLPAGGPVISGRGEYGNARWATNTEIRARFTGSGPGILLGKYHGIVKVPEKITAPIT